MPRHSHPERRKLALDVLGTMTGGRLEPAAVAAQLESRLGALGSFAIDFVMGDVWARPGLARRDRSIATLSSLVCQGRERELRFHVRAALEHGLTREEVVEIVTHLCAYAGFPAAQEAMEVALAVFGELDGGAAAPARAPAPRKHDDERTRDGLEVFSKLTGRDLRGRADDDLEARMGLVGKFAMEWAFGEIWCRPELSRRDRSLLIVAALTTLGKPAELDIHIPGALNHGVTEAELTELMGHLIVYTGFPAAVEASSVLRRVLKERAEVKG